VTQINVIMHHFDQSIVKKVIYTNLCKKN